MAKVYLDAGDNFVVASANTVVYGASGSDDRVTVLADVTGVVLDQNIERINLSGNSTDYRYQQQGNSLRVFSADGSFLLMTIPLQDDANGSQMAFADGIVSVKYDTSSGTGVKLNFGGTTVDSTTATKLIASTISAPDGSVVTSSKTFTLTAGVNSGTDFKGGSGNDTYNAALSNSANTLNNLDSLDGGAGTDTLNLELAGGTVTPVGLTGIEVYNISASGNSTLDLVNATGVATIASAGSSATLTLSNIPSAAASLSIANSTQNHTFNFASAAVSGASDTLSLTLSSVTSDPLVTIGSGIETVSLTVVGTNDVDTAFAGKLKISGAGDLTLTAASDATLGVTSIDASLATGSISVATTGAATVSGGSGNDTMSGGAANASSLNGGAGNDSITGGSGNDTLSGGDGVDTITTNAGNDNVAGGAGNDVIIFGANLTSADTIDGGEGTDTVTAESAQVQGQTTSWTNFTNVEILNVSVVADSTNSFDVTKLSSSISRVNLSGAQNLTGNAQSITFGSGSSTVGLNVASAISAGDTLSVTASGTGTADSLAILNMLTTGDFGTSTSNVTLSGFESASINTGAYSTATVQNLGAVNAGSSTAVSVSGSNGLTLAAGFVGSTLDASGIVGGGTKALVMSGAATTVTSIVGSAGNDTLWGDNASNLSGGDGNDSLVGGSLNDTITGGTGNDTITASGGVDSVAGGDGDDSITFAGELSFTDRVDGGAGNDTVVISNASLTNIKTASLSESIAFSAGFTGVEVLELTDSLADSFDLGYVASVSTVRLKVAPASGRTLSGFDSGDSLSLWAASSSLTASVVGATAGASDVLTLSLANDSSTDFGTLTLASVETLNIATSEVTATASAKLHEVGLTLSQAGSAAQTVVITGTESLKINTAVAAGTINASGLTLPAITDAGLKMTAGFTATSAIASQTITGSAGKDVIFGSSGSDSLVSGTGDDTITGGDGADTIDAGAGADSVYGGLGADVIYLGSADAAADAIYYVGAGFETGAVPATAIENGVQVVAGTSISTTALDKIYHFAAGDGIQLNAGGTQASVAMGGVFGSQGFVRGTYDVTAQTFVFSASGSDTLLAYDNDGSGTAPFRGIVLVGYVDTAGNDSNAGIGGVTGLLGVSG